MDEPTLKDFREGKAIPMRGQDGTLVFIWIKDTGRPLKQKVKCFYPPDGDL
jgi:hypothetical protein